jgi:hypothetical protein
MYPLYYHIKFKYGYPYQYLSGYEYRISQMHFVCLLLAAKKLWNGNISLNIHRH